jgi:hypothetical protein
MISLDFGTAFDSNSLQFARFELINHLLESNPLYSFVRIEVLNQPMSRSAICIVIRV